MRQRPNSPDWGRVPVPIVVTLLVLLPIGPVGWLLGRAGAQPQPQARPAQTLAQIAAGAGCRLSEFQDGMRTNPPVSGRFTERARTGDGSYAGKRPPSLAASMHALFHGRVLFQYRPGLPAREVRALDRMARADAEKVLLFENRTAMPAAVAATAYLSVMTCPRVDARTLAALSAFRERRRAFGQRF